LERLTTEIRVGIPPAPISFSASTVKVIVRHNASCRDKNRGSDWRKCRFPNALLIFEAPGSGRNRRVSAKTRSWEQAEKRAQELRDSRDRERFELKRLRTQEERQQVRLEEAVALFLADQITRLGDNSTVRNSWSLLGYINLRDIQLAFRRLTFTGAEPLGRARSPIKASDHLGVERLPLPKGVTQASTPARGHFRGNKLP
jgi:hypothetical protein